MKIYLVKGAWSTEFDGTEWDVKVFSDKVKAEKWAEDAELWTLLNKDDSAKSPYDPDTFWSTGDETSYSVHEFEVEE